MFGFDRPDPKEIERLHRSGVPPELIDQLMQPATEDVCLDQTEFDAFRLFGRMQTQWYRDAMTRAHMGLRYPSIAAVAFDIEVTEDIFACLQMMEETVREESIKRADKTDKK